MPGSYRVFHLVPEHRENIHDSHAPGVTAGTLRKQDPRLMAFVLAGMINSFVLSWMQTRERGSLCELTETLLAIFFEGVKASAA